VGKRSGFFRVDFAGGANSGFKSPGRPAFRAHGDEAPPLTILMEKGGTRNDCGRLRRSGVWAARPSPDVDQGRPWTYGGNRFHLRWLGTASVLGQATTQQENPAIAEGATAFAVSRLLEGRAHIHVDFLHRHSTIFGAFQAILATPFFQTSPSKLRMVFAKSNRFGPDPRFAIYNDGSHPAFSGRRTVKACRGGLLWFTFATDTQ